MKAHTWPGNVRELENLVRRLAALNREDVLSEAMVAAELASFAPPPALDGAADPRQLAEMVERYLADYFGGYGKSLPPPNLYDRILHEIERPLLLAALTATRGNQIKAADLLGLNRNTLRKKIRDLDIQVFRASSG